MTTPSQKNEKNIGNFLHTNHALQSILQKANFLKELDEILKRWLDKDMALNCCVANFRDNILVIQCTNAAWATRFKFLIHDLLKNLRLEPKLSSLKSISLIIAKS